MGMTGCYLAANNDVIEDIKSGQLDIFDIDEDEYPVVDIDKSWQAIHFLLCNSIADGELPLGYVVPLRTESVLPDLDIYGAFALTPEQAQMAYNSIKDIDEDVLRSKYNFELLKENEVYPIVDDEDSNDFFEYVYENFKSVQELYATATQNKYGVVFYIY